VGRGGARRRLRGHPAFAVPRDHTNPPATNDFTWSSAEAEAIAREACYDCHSNETDWWWATNIAPFSWLVQRDVDEGRASLNFSEWSGWLSPKGMRAAVNDGMPPVQYLIIHWGARLSDDEKKTLVDGFAASLGKDSGSPPSASPSASPSPDATTSPAAGDVEAIAAARCATCHSAQVALDYRTDSTADAAALIEDMVSRGATVTGEEKQTLVDYFTR